MGLAPALVTKEKGRIVAASQGERISSPLNKERDSTLWQRKAPPNEGSVIYFLLFVYETFKITEW
jgi:hypothetical protein